jgi:hypothetical protein
MSKFLKVAGISLLTAVVGLAVVAGISLAQNPTPAAPPGDKGGPGPRLGLDGPGRGLDGLRRRSQGPGTDPRAALQRAALGQDTVRRGQG